MHGNPEIVWFSPVCEKNERSQDFVGKDFSNMASHLPTDKMQILRVDARFKWLEPIRLLVRSPLRDPSTGTAENTIRG